MKEIPREKWDQEYRTKAEKIDSDARLVESNPGVVTGRQLFALAEKQRKDTSSKGVGK